MFRETLDLLFNKWGQIRAIQATPLAHIFLEIFHYQLQGSSLIGSPKVSNGLNVLSKDNF